MKFRNIFLGFLFFVLIILSAVGCSYQDKSQFPISKKNAVYSDLGNSLPNENRFHDLIFLSQAEWNISQLTTDYFFNSDKKLNTKINSGVKTLSGNDLEPISFSFFVSPLLVPLNCDYLSKINEFRICDFSPEIFISSLSTLFINNLSLIYFCV